VVADLVPPDRVGVAYALNRKLGGAVTRNRIRRRLRSAVDALDKQGGVLQDGAGYLVAADTDAASCQYTVLQAWVEDAVRAANARSTERTPR
jgi:ribonuclease P protein component